MEMNGRAQSPIGMEIDATVNVLKKKSNAAPAAGKFGVDVTADKASSSCRRKRIVNFSPWRYTRACDGIAA
jgi:hypothetical protein